MSIDLFVHMFYYVLSVRKLNLFDLLFIVYMFLYVFPRAFKLF